MATITSQTLFITTSPRSPEKMIPEIALLVKHFSGRAWNTETQSAFSRLLSQEDFYQGQAQKDPAFSARDRINRAPKSLGFVSLSPVISLTDAGRDLLESPRKDEVLLRQLLKFQLPSPYHKTSVRGAAFCVKPYLELLRLIRTLGSLHFDELQAFGLQLTDWHKFDKIVTKIVEFRSKRQSHAGGYSGFFRQVIEAEIREIYASRIAQGQTKTRESLDISTARFIHTQHRNLRDYADACFRYLSATGLVRISRVGKSLSIAQERIPEVDFILDHVERAPLQADQASYTSYLGNNALPVLLTDERERAERHLLSVFPDQHVPSDWTVAHIKQKFSLLLAQRKQRTMELQVARIKDYEYYDDIQATYEQIALRKVYDAPLMLEWNTWRAMTMLDGGHVKANLHFDDHCQPQSTAPGNMADIVCDYGDFLLTVEVTMATAQRQYETESEPVSRHLGRLKAQSGKPCYCLFLAPKINDAVVAHFYVLHRTSIQFYGGTSVIVPLPLATFRKMLENSFGSSYIPQPEAVLRLFRESEQLAKNSTNERQWYDSLCRQAACWPTI